MSARLIAALAACALLALLAPLDARADGEYRLGTRAGAGVIEAEPYLVVVPWAGAAWGALSLAVQVPLRVAFETAQIRSRDWDEPADYGRLLRFAAYDDLVRVGVLADLTLGHGTLVRRYHNGVDEDHHRTGMRVSWAGDALSLDAFADQLLAPPVVGLRLGWRFAESWTAALVGAADTAFPDDLDGTAESTGRLSGDSRVYLGVGLELSYALVPADADGALSTYLAIQLLDAEAAGAHLGLVGATRPSVDWRLEGRVEGILLSPGYRWSPFDTGFLIDRYSGDLDTGGTVSTPGSDVGRNEEGTVGGRVGLTVAYREAVVVGAEYADALVDGRADVSAWLQVPLSRYTVVGYWRQRGGPERASVFDPSEALAAAAGIMQLSDGWWIDVTLARVWRVLDEPAGSGEQPPGTEGAQATPALRYEPTTEFFITLEANFGL